MSLNDNFCVWKGQSIRVEISRKIMLWERSPAKFGHSRHFYHDICARPKPPRTTTSAFKMAAQEMGEA